MTKIENFNDLTISFTNVERARECNRCIVNRGNNMMGVDQVIYMTGTWTIKDHGLYGVDAQIKKIRESYCYYCAMDLIDKWKNGIRETYMGHFQEKGIK